MDCNRQLTKISSLIIQWGIGSIQPNTHTLITMPTSFPNGYRIGTTILDGGYATFKISVSKTMPTGFTMATSFSAPTGFIWLAVGY